MFYFSWGLETDVVFSLKKKKKFTKSSKCKFKQVNCVVTSVVTVVRNLYCDVTVTTDVDHYISSEQAFGGFLAFFAYQVTEIIFGNSQ